MAAARGFAEAVWLDARLATQLLNDTESVLMSTPPKSSGQLFCNPERVADCKRPTDADVLQQLARILAHPLFQTAQRLTAFLRFVVENVIAGRAGQLKEYVIGVEIFDRGVSYSPQADPVVRVMAGRLRSRLAEYYQGSGHSDPVLIELPRGGYVARLSWRQQPAAPQALPITQERLPSVAFTRSDSVGREDESRRLRAASGSACSGAGAMLTICGEAGMGKTTIAEDFLAEIQSEQQAPWVGTGRCSERLADTDALAPIFESLERLLRFEFRTQIAQIIKTTAPAWYRQIAPANDDPGEVSARAAATSSPERMRREFVSLLERLSLCQPVVLFLDDMHWADASTCDLLTYLGTRVRNLRILVLMTYRPAEVLARQHPFLPLKVHLERRGVCEDVPLSFLGLSDIEHYVRVHFPENTFPVIFSQVVHERTEGNPLFMKDMLRFLCDLRILAERDGKWMLEQPVTEVRKLLPTRIGSMIRLKIDQLSNENRQVLLCAAVQGLQFDSAVVAKVLSLDPSEVEEQLQELDAAHNFVSIVTEQEFANHVFSVRYRFVHVFYQNALCALLAPSRRAAYSLAIARTLVEFTGDASRDMAADLALLFELVRDYASASQCFLHAARNAAHVFAYPEAVILSQRGQRALASLAESRDRDAQELRFSLILGMSLMATRGYADPEVEKTHRRSRELCHRLKETRRLVSVLWGLHTSTHIAGDLVDALEVAREFREVAEASGDPIAVVQSLHALGTTLAFMGRLAEGRQALERIFAAYPLSQHEFHGSLYVLDPFVTSLSMLARLLEPIS
jgi:hypothetical protein